jgi:metallo-beta-lactamase family protein
MRWLESAIDELSWGFEYQEVFYLKKGIAFKLGNAGHILGSCFIRFCVPYQTGGHDTVMFSGDPGCTDTPILPDPDPPDACDLLILESTYGDRNHIGRMHRIKTLKVLLGRALADNGIAI